MSYETSARRKERKRSTHYSTIFKNTANVDGVTIFTAEASLNHSALPIRQAEM